MKDKKDGGSGFVDAEDPEGYLDWSWKVFGAAVGTGFVLVTVPTLFIIGSVRIIDRFRHR
jgi:hypothetical protein